MLQLGLGAAESERPGTFSAFRGWQPPEAIGPYRILRRLGEGGMGTVFLAEQAAPVRRNVALKIVKPEIGSVDVIRRFEAERHALALMEHPAIARVYDAGETDEGLPYFAMEYVDGEPITAHCDRERLSTRERLELLAEVCVAVQHAHRKGVIHRDIKPSNVLVTRVDGRAVPKIIDFGVAKAVEQRLTERSLFTELGVIVGTPEYMSPEQAEFTGERVDTRTDVYSLGVLQYELMTGALPFASAELRAGGFEQICRRIREEEPPRPSARVGGAGEEAERAASLRRADPVTLRRQLAGDLDWVAMKALEKDPDRRYGSPQELADDLRRYLRHEPVLAGPPSAAYRLRKFVRRHRLAVSSAAAVLVAILAGGVGTTIFALREAAQRREAERAREDLEKVVEFQARMISDVEPAEMGDRLLADLSGRLGEAARAAEPSGGDLAGFEGRLGRVLEQVNGTDAALRLLDEEILERAAHSIEAEFTEEPLIEARLRLSLAATYRSLGLYERATPHIDRALQLRRHALGASHPETLGAQSLLGTNHADLGRYDEAEAVCREAAETAERSLGPEHPATLEARARRGFALRRLGRYDEAETILAGTLQAYRRLFGPDDPRTLDTLESLAKVYNATNRPDLAEPLAIEALEARTRRHGPDHPLTLNALEMRANVAWMMRRLDEAERLFLDEVAAKKRLLGSRHPDLAISLSNLGGVYVEQGKLDEASAAFGEALEIARERFGPEHLNTISMTMNLATVRMNAGRPDEAVPLYESGIALMEKVVGEGHPSTLQAKCNLGVVLWRLGRFEEASRRCRPAADHPRATATVKLLAAGLLIDPTPAMDLDAAIGYSRQALELSGGDNVSALFHLARALAGAGRHAEAAPVWKQTVDHPQAGPTEMNTYAWYLLTSAPEDPGNAPTALEYARRAAEPPGDRDPDILDTLALAWHRTGDSGKAVETIERALALVAPGDTARRAPFEKSLAEYRAALRDER